MSISEDTKLKILSSWIDKDGLMGNQTNPTFRSTGNEILDTAFCIDISNDKEFIKARQKAILNCKSENGLFNKNPGRLDEITFDDLIGAAYSSEEAAKIICDFGNNHYWLMSNTGKFYYSAYSRPYLIAYYKIAAEIQPKFWETTLLCISLLLFGGNSSELRLQYLICKKISQKTPWGTWFFNRLMNYINKKYGSLSKLQLDYYKVSYNPIVIYS